jgi:hypothetical protein
VLATRCRRFGPRLTVSLCDADHDRLQHLAEKDEVSISWAIRRAIEDYLRRRPDGCARDRVVRTIPKRERRAI